MHAIFMLALMVISILRYNCGVREVAGVIHYKAIQMDGYRQLSEGQEVEFLQVKSEKGWQADEVEALET
jgi:hypothetical protein